MEKSEIQELETIQAKEPWNKQDSEESKEIFETVFETVLYALQNHPELYYIKIGGDYTEVLRRADNTVIYHTSDLIEIAQVQAFGLEK